MFEDKTYDNIMAAMMQEITASGLNVRTDEGSLLYNACARIAVKLEETYGELALLYDNLLPDTMEIDYLIRYGEARGIPYKYATAPTVRGVFSMDIPIGSEFTCGEYTYVTTSQLTGDDYGPYDYLMTCTTEGTEANTTTGTLEAVDYVEGYSGDGYISEIVTAGTDDQDEELYRKEVIDAFKVESFGGNRKEYRDYIDNINGVGGCIPIRAAAAGGDVNVYVIGADYSVPSTALIDQIQTEVDPTVNSGAGEGMAPICHIVAIHPVAGTSCDVSLNLTFDTGYSVSDVRTLVEEAIASYLLELRTDWESNDTNDTIVRIAKIDAAVLNIDGIIDVTGTRINGSAGNLTLPYTTVPVLGEVIIS